MIDNTIFRNANLSYKAKGLLCQMLSLPDGWEYSIEGLTTLATDGKSAVMSALAELKEAGYFFRKQVRENDKIAGVEYVISEYPMSENLFAENQHTDNQHTDNPPQYITNISNTKESITKDIHKGASEKPKKKFVKPNIEEVKAYIKEQGFSVDADRFYDYYESNGWRVGKSSMKDWKAALRNWERNSYGTREKVGRGKNDLGRSAEKRRRNTEGISQGEEALEYFKEA